MLPSKWSIVCAIINSAVDIGRRAAGQINSSNCRLLIQTTQTCSLPLRYPKMITAAVDLMVEQQQPTSPLNQYFLPFHMGRRVAVEMVYCLRNHQSGYRHGSKSIRAFEHLNLLTTDSNYTDVQFTVAVSENDHRTCRSHRRSVVAYIAAESILSLVSHVMKCCRRMVYYCLRSHQFRC